MIGIISDTHGLLREEAVRELRGTDLIVHAGDVGSPEILDRLREIAPVTAVRGNVDRGAWADGLPATATVTAAGSALLVIHQLSELEGDPAALGYAAVVSGHSHKAVMEKRGGVLYLNPGSAGPRRFRLPVTLARMRAEPGSLKADIVTLLR